jgi:hypothetical protein
MLEKMDVAKDTSIIITTSNSRSPFARRQERSHATVAIAIPPSVLLRSARTVLIASLILPLPALSFSAIIFLLL